MKEFDSLEILKISKNENVKIALEVYARPIKKCVHFYKIRKPALFPKVLVIPNILMINFNIFDFNFYIFYRQFNFSVPHGGGVIFSNNDAKAAILLKLCELLLRQGITVILKWVQ